MGASGLTGQAINSLMKDGLRLDAAGAALFQALATAPTYFAPLYAFLSDSRPLFGSRRKSYLAIGGCLCAGAWALLGLASSLGYPAALLSFSLALLALSFLTTVANAHMVEEGKRLSLTGAFQSVQWLAANLVALPAAALSGLLVSRHGVAAPFYLFALVPLLVTPSSLLLVREVSTEASSARVVWRKLGEAFREPAMRASVAGVFLWFFSPGLGLPAYYYQRDELRFSIENLGYLASIGQGAGILGAGAYALLCRKCALRTLLCASIALGSAAHLGFLSMRDLPTAQVLTAADGFISMFAMLALFDLAARCSPKGAEGSAFAVTTAARVLAILGGGYAGGWLYERAGFQTLVVVSAAFTVGCLGMLRFVKADKS